MCAINRCDLGYECTRKRQRLHKRLSVKIASAHVVMMMVFAACTCTLTVAKGTHKRKVCPTERDIDQRRRLSWPRP